MSHLAATDYATWLQSLKEQIRLTRLKASLAVNRELVLLYWRIGKEILARKAVAAWGTKINEQLARDLRTAFPDMRGMSPRNLVYMQTLAREWPDEHITQQLVAQLPWGHNCLLLDKLSDRSTREWYIQKTIENGWSRSVLELQIETQVHLRVGPPRRTLTVPCRRHSQTWHATSSKTRTPSIFWESRMPPTSARLNRAW